MERQMKECTVLVHALGQELKGEDGIIKVGESGYDLVVERSSPDNEVEGLNSIDFYSHAADYLFDESQRFDLRGRVVRITACYRKGEQSDAGTTLEEAFEMLNNGPWEWEFEDVKETSATDSGSDFYRIDFEDVTITERTKYHDMIEGMRDIIGGCGQTIHGKLFSLAINGVWRKWSEAQPAGATIRATNDMLLKTGDKNIDLLWELLDKMEEVFQKLSSDTPPGQPAKIDFLDAGEKMPNKKT